MLEYNYMHFVMTEINGMYVYINTKYILRSRNGLLPDSKCHVSINESRSVLEN